MKLGINDDQLQLVEDLLADGQAHSTAEFAELTKLKGLSVEKYLRHLVEVGRAAKVPGPTGTMRRWVRRTPDNSLPGDLPPPWRISFAFTCVPQ